jgi:hypothetical protein
MRSIIWVTLSIALVGLTGCEVDVQRPPAHQTTIVEPAPPPTVTQPAPPATVVQPAPPDVVTEPSD